MHQSLGIAVENFLTIPILAFVFGALAARVRGDLRLPGSIYQFITAVLLLAIGLKGGVALRQTELASLIGPVAVTLALGVAIPVAVFFILRVVTGLSQIDRGAVAAHYGSTSVVTFTAAIALLQSANIPFEGYTASLLALMEVPGIIVGLWLATAGSSRDHAASVAWHRALTEVLTSRSILLLVGGLLMGAMAGPVAYARVEPLFGGLFQGLLVLFLLHCGSVVGRSLGDLRETGWALGAFGVLFPILAGTVGVAMATLVGMSTGGAMLVGVLAASASYIAAPAAVRIALPEAHESLALTSSLAVTFPFNLILGLPLYLALAQILSSMG